MEPIDGNGVVSLSEADNSSGTIAAASQQAAARTVEPIVPGFDPTSIRCAAECRLRELIWKHEDVARSGEGLSEARMEALDHLRRMLHLGHEIATEVLENSGNGEEPSGEQAATAEEGETPEDTAVRPESARCSTDLEPEDILAAIRQVFSAGGPRDREAAIRDIFSLLPGRRLTSRVREQIDNALTTAAHRGIVHTEGGLLCSDCRTIGDYPRELLKKHLVGVMKGSWWDEDEAIRAAARHLGFSKAGTNIQAEFRSAIRGALRQGLLERDGTMIRRARWTQFDPAPRSDYYSTSCGD